MPIREMRSSDESGEDSPCLRRRTSAIPDRARLRRFECKDESFESGRRGYASGYRLRQNVTGMQNIVEFKMDEISGRKNEVLINSEMGRASSNR